LLRGITHENKTTQKSSQNISDKLSLSGNILTINGKDYDLDSLLTVPEATEDNQDAIIAFYAENKCYIDNAGITQLKIAVDNAHFFLFINNNYLLFHDKDLNGEIDLTELEDLIRCYNQTEEERRAEHKAYRDSFTPEEWKARMEACNPKR